jgi:hypothetical protein
MLDQGMSVLVKIFPRIFLLAQPLKDILSRIELGVQIRFF